MSNRGFIEMSETPEQAARRAAYLASDWHRAFSGYLEAWGSATTEERDALEHRLGDTATAILAEPASTPDELIVRAAITVQWNSPEVSDPVGIDDASVAALARGVLGMAGLTFDADGRVFPA
jgi:hypothetical protein